MRAIATIHCQDLLVATFAAILLCLASAVEANAKENSDESEKTPTPNTIPDDEVCQFWGNSFSLKFHLKSCPFAQAMNPGHVQFFNNAQEALSMGEKPCRWCLPPYELSVSCKVLKMADSSNQSDNSDEKKLSKIAN